MQTSLSILENARIAAPCSVEWSAMQGDDRVRFCSQCEKNVYNLVGMDDNEADALLAEHEGHACIRAYQRADGTLMTQNCPVGLRKLRRRLAVGVGAIAAGFAALIGVLTFGYSSRRGVRLTNFQPFKRLAQLVNPPVTGFALGSTAPPGATTCGSITYTIAAVRENGKLEIGNEAIAPESPSLVPSQLVTSPVTIPYQPGYVPESEDFEIGIPMFGNAWRPPLILPVEMLSASNNHKSLRDNERFDQSRR